MKTMTRGQLDGACDLTHLDAIAGQLIQAQDRHLCEADTRGDTPHERARAAMKGRQKRSIWRWVGIAT